MAYTPCLALVAVFVVQLFLVTVFRLDPWKGGGFGMFSTLGEREARIELQFEDGVRCLVAPRGHDRELRSTLRDAKRLPTKRLLRRARQVLTRTSFRVRDADVYVKDLRERMARKRISELVSVDNDLLEHPICIPHQEGRDPANEARRPTRVRITVFEAMLDTTSSRAHHRKVARYAW